MLLIPITLLTVKLFYPLVWLIIVIPFLPVHQAKNYFITMPTQSILSGKEVTPICGRSFPKDE